jgi:nicotinate-nucleotide adenylyltransferase
MSVPHPGQARSGPAPTADVAVSYAPTAAGMPERPARVGVMGGTFDPIHHGHLVAASEVASLFHLDEVVFVPTSQPWQKTGRRVSPAEDRYLMTVIATASNPRFTVSRVDIDRGGLTYTVDTLRDLRAERAAGTEFFFITGADALDQIFTWQNADELFEMAHFVGCTRPGHHLADPGLPAGKASLVEIPALAISSTACRERVRRGEPVWYLVPDGIVQYINKRGLYRDPAEPGPHLGRPHAAPTDPPSADPASADPPPPGSSSSPSPAPTNTAEEAP